MKEIPTTYILKFHIYLAFLLLKGVSVFAQSGSVLKDVDILENQEIVLKEDYPNVFAEVDIKKVQKINNKHTKVYYEKGNQHYEAVVNSGRKDLLLVATSKLITENELPNIVMDAFKSSKFKNWNIVKTFEVLTPYSSLFYRIDVTKNKRKKDESKIRSLFYSHLGQYKKPPY